MNLCEQETTTVGSTFEIKTTLADAIRDAIAFGCYTFSIQLGRSRNFMRRRIDTTDLAESLLILDRFPSKVATIIPDMYNLAGSRKFLAWNGNEDQDAKTLFHIREIEYELYLAGKLDGYSIIELGSSRNKEAGLKSVIHSLSKIGVKERERLCIANSLDQFDALGTTLDRMKTVWNTHRGKIAFFLHYLYVNGIYDFRQTSEFDKFLRDVQHTFGQYPFVLFIQDTSSAFASKEFCPTELGSVFTSDIVWHIIEECADKNILLHFPEQSDMDIIFYSIYMRKRAIKQQE